MYIIGSETCLVHSVSEKLYLFNYGDSCPMTLDEMKFQMELYYKFLKEKKIQGVIVCSNNIVDTGLEAPEYLRQWLAEHGGEEL